MALHRSPGISCLDETKALIGSASSGLVRQRRIFNGTWHRLAQDALLKQKKVEKAAITSYGKSAGQPIQTTFSIKEVDRACRSSGANHRKDQGELADEKMNNGLLDLAEKQMQHERCSRRRGCRER